MSISVIFVGKNLVKMGYCFWESLQSCFPFADEILISEGYSSDDTLKYLEAFTKKYSPFIPITLYQDEWIESSYVGEAITKATETVIKRANCDFVYYLQADEIIHEDLAIKIKEVSKNPNYNSFSFPFYHFNRSWSPDKHPAYKEAIRMARRNKLPKLKGDAWTFVDIDPVCNANNFTKPIYHFNWIFPRTNDVKDIEHANIYQNVPSYQDRKRFALRIKLIDRNIEKSYKTPYPRTDFDDFPELSRRFIGVAEYPLPDIYD